MDEAQQQERARKMSKAIEAILRERSAEKMKHCPVCGTELHLFPQPILIFATHSVEHTHRACPSCDYSDDLYIAQEPQSFKQLDFDE